MALSPRFEKLVSAGKMDPMKAQARSARAASGKLPFQRPLQTQTTSTVPPGPQGARRAMGSTDVGGAGPNATGFTPGARPQFQSGGGLQGGPAVNPQDMVERLPAGPQGRFYQPAQMPPAGGAADFLNGSGLQQLLARLRGTAGNAQGGAPADGAAQMEPWGPIQQLPGGPEQMPGGGMTKPLDMGPAGVDSNAFSGQGQDTQGNAMIPGLGSVLGGQGGRLGAILGRLGMGRRGPMGGGFNTAIPAGVAGAAGYLR
jgi:hypothetical protein